MRFASGIDHLNPQLVPKHAWIIKKRLLAGKRVKIGSTHPYAMNPHQRFARSWLGFGYLGSGKLAGLIESNLKHEDERLTTNGR